MVKKEEREALMELVLKKWRQSDITDYALGKAIGIARINFPAFKAGKKLPHLDNIKKLYNYFYGENPNEELSINIELIKKEIELLNKRVEELAARVA